MEHKAKASPTCSLAVIGLVSLPAAAHLHPPHLVTQFIGSFCHSELSGLAVACFSSRTMALVLAKSTANSSFKEATMPSSWSCFDGCSPVFCAMPSHGHQNVVLGHLFQGVFDVPLDHSIPIFQAIGPLPEGT